jgi:hypothetical protein
MFTYRAMNTEVQCYVFNFRYSEWSEQQASMRFMNIYIIITVIKSVPQFQL